MSLSYFGWILDVVGMLQSACDSGTDMYMDLSSADHNLLAERIDIADVIFSAKSPTHVQQPTQAPSTLTENEVLYVPMYVFALRCFQSVLMDSGFWRVQFQYCFETSIYFDGDHSL